MSVFMRFFYILHYSITALWEAIRTYMDLRLTETILTDWLSWIKTKQNKAKNHKNKKKHAKQNNKKKKYKKIP